MAVSSPCMGAEQSEESTVQLTRECSAPALLWCPCLTNEDAHNFIHISDTQVRKSCPNVPTGTLRVVLTISCQWKAGAVGNAHVSQRD